MPIQSAEIINDGPVWLRAAQSTEALFIESVPVEYSLPNISAEEGVPHSAVIGAAKRGMNHRLSDIRRKASLEVK